MKRDRKEGLFKKELVLEAIKQSFIKLHPKYQFRNPVMFTVEIGTVVMMVVCAWILSGENSQGSFAYNFIIFLILLATLLFANFAEALAEAKLRWSNAGIVNYELVVGEHRNYWSRGCTWTSIVVDGVVGDTVVTPPGSSCSQVGWTVEQLHDDIGGMLSAIEEFAGPEWGRHTLDVTFDDVGVPVEIEFDLTNGDDEETSTRASLTPRS